MTYSEVENLAMQLYENGVDIPVSALFSTNEGLGASICALSLFCFFLKYFFFSSLVNAATGSSTEPTCFSGATN